MVKVIVSKTSEQSVTHQCEKFPSLLLENPTQGLTTVNTTLYGLLSPLYNKIIFFFYFGLNHSFQLDSHCAACTVELKPYLFHSSEITFTAKKSTSHVPVQAGTFFSSSQFQFRLEPSAPLLYLQ